MTDNQDPKNRVRARMKKTGKSYAAARAQILGDRKASPDEYEDLAGIKDASVSAKTGKSWAEWLNILDKVGAQELSHRDIAAYLHTQHAHIGAWWAQAVTVGYERIRGLRLKGQTCKRTFFVANKSKTFATGIDSLFEAFQRSAIRKKWCPLELKERSAQLNKSIRFTCDDQSRVNVYFSNKGAQKSSAALQHEGLTRQAAISGKKEEWALYFKSLAELLE